MENRKKSKRNCLQLSLGNGQNPMNLILSGSDKNILINFGSKDVKKTKRVCQIRKPMWIPPPAKTTRRRRSCCLYTIPENDILLTLPQESRFQLPEGIPLVIESCHLENFRASIYPQTLERSPPPLIKGLSDTLDDLAKPSKKQSAVAVRESEQVFKEHEKRKSKLLKHVAAIKKNMEEMNESIKEIEKNESINIDFIEKIIHRQVSEKQVHDSSDKGSVHSKIDSNRHSPDIITVGSKTFIQPTEVNIPSDTMLEKITKKDEKLKTKMEKHYGSNQKISAENFMMKLMDSMRKSKQLLDETVQRNHILNETRKNYMQVSEKLCKDQQRLLSEFCDSDDASTSILSQGSDSCNSFDNKQVRSKNHYYGTFTKSADSDREEFSEVGIAKFKINSMPIIQHHIRNQSLAEQLAIANHQLERMKREIQLIESKRSPARKHKTDNLRTDANAQMRSAKEREIKTPVSEESQTDSDTNFKEALATIIHKYNTLKQNNREKDIPVGMQTDNRMKIPPHMPRETEEPATHSDKENLKYLFSAKKAMKILEEEMEKLIPRVSDEKSQTEPTLVEHYEKNITIEPVRGIETIINERSKPSKTKKNFSIKERVRKERIETSEAGTSTDQEERMVDPASISIHDTETSTQTSKDSLETGPRANISVTKVKTLHSTNDKEAQAIATRVNIDHDKRVGIKTPNTLVSGSISKLTHSQLHEEDDGSGRVKGKKTHSVTGREIIEISERDDGELPDNLRSETLSDLFQDKLDEDADERAKISYEKTHAVTDSTNIEINEQDDDDDDDEALISGFLSDLPQDESDEDDAERADVKGEETHAVSDNANIEINDQDDDDDDDDDTLVSGFLCDLPGESDEDDAERADVNGGETHAVSDNTKIEINEQDDDDDDEALVSGFLCDLPGDSYYVERADVNGGETPAVKGNGNIDINEPDDDDDDETVVSGFLCDLLQDETDTDDEEKSGENNIIKEEKLHKVKPLVSDSDKNIFKSDDYRGPLQNKITNKLKVHDNLSHPTSKLKNDSSSSISRIRALKQVEKGVPSDKNIVPPTSKGSSGFKVGEVTSDQTFKGHSMPSTSGGYKPNLTLEQKNLYSEKFRPTAELPGVSKAKPSTSEYQPSKTKAFVAPDKSFPREIEKKSTTGLDSRPTASIQTSQEYAMPSTSGGYNPYQTSGPKRKNYNERFRPTAGLDLKKNVPETISSTSGYRPSQRSMLPHNSTKKREKLVSGFRSSTPKGNEKDFLQSKTVNQNGMQHVSDKSRDSSGSGKWYNLTPVDTFSESKDIADERVNQNVNITPDSWSGNWYNLTPVDTFSESKDIADDDSSDDKLVEGTLSSDTTSQSDDVHEQQNFGKIPIPPVTAWVSGKVSPHYDVNYYNPKVQSTAGSFNPIHSRELNQHLDERRELPASRPPYKEWLKSTPIPEVRVYNEGGQNVPVEYAQRSIQNLPPNLYFQRNSMNQILQPDLVRQRCYSMPVNYACQQRQFEIPFTQNDRPKCVDYNRYEPISQSILRGENLFPTREENECAKNIYFNKVNNGMGLAPQTMSQQYTSAMPQTLQNRRFNPNIRSHSTSTPAVPPRWNSEILQRRQSLDSSNNEKQQMKIRKLYNEIMF